jgi:hypothetical protein
MIQRQERECTFVYETYESHRARDAAWVKVPSTWLRKRESFRLAGTTYWALAYAKPEGPMVTP